MTCGKLIWLWVGIIWLALPPELASATKLFCGESVRQTWRAWRAGIPRKPVTEKSEDPIELEDLEPDFQFVRERLVTHLYERHSHVRLYFLGGVLSASVPIGEPDLENYLTVEVPLAENEAVLFQKLFSTMNLASVENTSRQTLTQVFRTKVCEALFSEAQGDLLRVKEGHPEFQLNGSAVWRVPNERESDWIEFQVEGWVDSKGELVQTRFNGSVSTARRALLRMIVGKGLIEIRALKTDTLEPGYHFIRVPQGWLMNREGHFARNLEKFAVGLYLDALERGQVVNGDHFPFHHRHLTRSLEIGLDPDNQYGPLSYAGRSLLITNGNLAGKRAVVLSEKQPEPSLNGGYRRELNLKIENYPLEVRFFNSFVTPVSDEPMQAGLDPLNRLPMKLEVGEELVVRGSGERARAKVVAENKGRGPVRSYIVEYLTGPLQNTREVKSTGELIPQRYLPLTLPAPAPDSKSEEPDLPNQDSPTNETTP